MTHTSLIGRYVEHVSQKCEVVGVYNDRGTSHLILIREDGKLDTTSTSYTELWVEPEPVVEDEVVAEIEADVAASKEEAPA